MEQQKDMTRNVKIAFAGLTLLCCIMLVVTYYAFMRNLRLIVQLTAAEEANKALHSEVEYLQSQIDSFINDEDNWDYYDSHVPSDSEEMRMFMPIIGGSLHYKVQVITSQNVNGKQNYHAAIHYKDFDVDLLWMDRTSEWNIHILRHSDNKSVAYTFPVAFNASELLQKELQRIYRSGTAIINDNENQDV